MFQVSGHFGVIESPNFPLPYPHNRNCSWVIAAPKGNKINVTFSNFELETHSRSGNCTFDHLTVAEFSSKEINDRATVLGSYCGANVPSRLSSSTDRLLINFVSDHTVAHNGFRLEWVVEGCGGRLTKPSGYFFTPNWPNAYPDGVECIWVIEAELGSKVELTITEYQMEGHSDCQYDYLKIYGGPDETSPLLTKLCDSHTVNSVLTSLGNKMLVKFGSDSSRSSKGFNAKYKSIPGGCGGLMKLKSGSITSPNYPNNYDPHDDCGWLLEVDNNHAVKLTFEDFDVEPHSNCSYDHVSIYDGNSIDAPLLLVHCGQNLPEPNSISSTGNQMFVRLKADGSVSSKGFKANFERGCGAHIITEGEGVLTSPGYPHFWAENGNCSWIIKGGHESDRVTLHITYMDLDQPENFGNCSEYGGNIEIRDGNGPEAPLIERFCGMTTPPSITTQGSTMFVHIRNNVIGRDMHYHSSNTFQRFRAIYTVEDTACGGTLSSMSGRFASPDFPNSYPMNVECVWIIKAPAGNIAHLFFSQFDLEESEDCNKDYLDVYQNGPDGINIGRYCGSSPPLQIAPLQTYWIKFNSDDSQEGQGFIAQYNVQYGGQLTGASGEIESVDYPHVYLNAEDADITWTITVNEGNVVGINFIDFELEQYSDEYCLHTMKVYDGPSNESPVLYEGCGSTKPDPIQSSSNTATVVWSLTGYASFGSKFKLSWRSETRSRARLIPSNRNITACGGPIVLDPNGNRTYLSSPGYPQQYPSNLNCEWIVQTSEDRKIKMTIIRLRLGIKMIYHYLLFTNI